MSQKFPLGSYFWWIFCFSMLESSMDLTRILWLYVLLIHTPLNFYPESTLDILKCIVTTLRNKYKNVAFIWVDKYGSLSRYYESTKTCHDMNIIIQTTDGYASSLNGIIEIPNKTPANTKSAFILNSIHKKEPWCFPYQYAI